MALHKINTDKKQVRIGLISRAKLALLYDYAPLDIGQKFLEYYGFKSYGQVRGAWKY